MERLPFHTVELVIDPSAEGTEIRIQALTDDYTEADWNEAAAYIRHLDLPPMHSSHENEFAWSAWFPTEAPVEPA